MGVGNDDDVVFWSVTQPGTEAVEAGQGTLLGRRVLAARSMSVLIVLAQSSKDLCVDSQHGLKVVTYPSLLSHPHPTLSRSTRSSLHSVNSSASELPVSHGSRLSSCSSGAAINCISFSSSTSLNAIKAVSTVRFIGDTMIRSASWR